MKTLSHPKYAELGALGMYLVEIGKTPLITPAEEIALARRIKKGDAEAREAMIKANLRLVVKIARDHENLGLPLLDLINEGNIGLMKGVERFDPRKGAKFSTYGAWWIKQSIRRALTNQSKTIRLPVHVFDKAARIRRVALKLREILDREPTAEDIAAELNTTAEIIGLLKDATRQPVLLDDPLGDGSDERTIADIIPDEQASSASTETEGADMVRMLRELLPRLPNRELTILKCRFGLDGNDEMTLEDIGTRFGVTRERIRQLQEIALNKLRRMIRRYDTINTLVI